MSELCVRFVKGEFFLNDSGLSVKTKNPEKLSQDYIDRFLFSQSDKIYALGRGTAQKNLDIASFKQLVVTYPDSEEQKRIVNSLDSATNLYETYSQNLFQQKALFEELWDSVIQRAFTRTSLGDDINFLSLANVAKLVGGGTPSKNIDRFWGGDIPWASVRDLKGKLLSNTELCVTEDGLKNSSSKLIPKGNLVIATRVGLGKAVILEQATAINQDLKAVIPLNPETLDPTFLYYWYLSKARIVVNAGTGATVQGVKIPMIESLEIPIISITQQSDLVKKLEEIFTQISGELHAIELKKIESKHLLKRISSTLFGGTHG